MYQVVIVDDEKIIVDGLQKVIPWEKFGCEVAGTASDAGEGAHMIRTRRPDILFTDIRMPGQDGLAMLAGIKGEFPEMMITVLTGYRDFEYAQRAIQLGVSRFLLKPSKMEELEEALRFMTGVLDERQTRKNPEAEPGQEEEEGTNANRFLIRQAVAYIETHFARHIGLQEVADHCYVSQWHLSKQLNKYLNASFYELLNRERVRQAKILLKDPSLRIADIAEAVGYTDAAHFSRVFKKAEGVSAGDWRNQNA